MNKITKFPKDFFTRTRPHVTKKKSQLILYHLLGQMKY